MIEEEEDQHLKNEYVGRCFDTLLNTALESNDYQLYTFNKHPVPKKFRTNLSMLRGPSSSLKFLGKLQRKLALISVKILIWP